MASMTLDVYEYLLSQYGSALAVATVKGYPSWGKPEVVLPCVALEFMAWQPGHARVGQLMGTGVRGYRGWLFARHEPELCAMVDALLNWHMDHGAFEIAARGVGSGLLEVKRWEPETMTQWETHGVAFLVQATW